MSRRTRPPAVDPLSMLARQYREGVRQAGDPRSPRDPTYWQDFRARWGISPHTARKWVMGKGPQTRIPASVREAARQLGRAVSLAERAGRTPPRPDVEGRLARTAQQIAARVRASRRARVPSDLAERGIRYKRSDDYISKFPTQEELFAYLRKRQYPMPSAVIWQGDDGAWYWNIESTE